MNKGIVFVLGAIVGGAVGSVSTWYAVEKTTAEKYQKIANEEIESVKATYKEKYEKEPKSTSQNASVTHQEPRRAILGTGDDEEVIEDEKMPQNTNKRSKEHTDYSKISKNNAGLKAPMANNWNKELGTIPEEKKEMELKPYVISPQEFELSENEHVNMQYYLDGTLTDDMGEPIQSSDYFGDIDIENSFDDYSDEPDLLFIRDPRLKIDYEISKILVRYPETTGEWMGD